MTYLLVFIILVFAMVIVVQAYNTDKYIKDYRLLLMNGWAIGKDWDGTEIYFNRDNGDTFYTMAEALRHQRKKDSAAWLVAPQSDNVPQPDNAPKPYELGQWSTD